MALAEGQLDRNPRQASVHTEGSRAPVRCAMTIEEKQTMFAALDERERLIAKLAVLAGMRPGEIFALDLGPYGVHASRISGNGSTGASWIPCKPTNSIAAQAVPPKGC